MRWSSACQSSRRFGSRCSETGHLYDGDAEYERQYLRPHAASPRAVVVGALDRQALIGAAMVTPLSDREESVTEAARDLGLPQDQVFCLAESVLLPALRGRVSAMCSSTSASGMNADTAFATRCSLRDPAAGSPGPAGDGARPCPFWRGRGYAPVEGATGRLSWRDVGEPEETEKRLAIGLRDFEAPRG